MVILYSVYYKTLPNRINKEEHKIGYYDCKKSKYGCCNDKITPKYDDKGSNCRGF
jgi:hypothetical protein